MKKILLILLMIIGFVDAKDLKPTFVFKASGGVNDILKQDNKIYVSTASGSIDIFDFNKKIKIQSIKIPQIKDFTGDKIDAKIYNLDVYGDKIIFVAQSTSGFREIYLYQNDKLQKIIKSSDKLYVTKAKFISPNKILFSLLGNEMILYDMVKNKNIWKIDVRAKDAEFNSTFADFVLNKNKTLSVVADESGDLKLVDIKKAKVIKVLSGVNLDKVFKVDIKNNIIITAGQDRKCVVYNLNTNKSYYMDTKFLIYSAGLSPMGELGAYSSDEQNNVIVFNTKTKQKLFKLTKNLMTLTSILFISKNELFVTTDSNKFNYYKLQ